MFFLGFIEFLCIFEPGFVPRMNFEQIAMPNASLRRVSVSDADAQNRVLCEKLSFFAKVINEKQVISGTIWQKQKGTQKMFQNAFQFCDTFFEINCLSFFFSVSFFFTSISFKVKGHPCAKFQAQGSVCIVRRF